MVGIALVLVVLLLSIGSIGAILVTLGGEDF